MRKLCRQAGAVAAALWLAIATAAPAAAAQKVSFKDPPGDDNGPGKITYPTDPAYPPGSFDMTGFELKAHGDKVDLDVEMAAKLDDPWQTGSGFSVQMVFVFIRAEAKVAETPAERKARNKKKAEAAKAAAEKAGAGKAGAAKAGADAATAVGEPAAAATPAADQAAAEQAAGATPAAAPAPAAKAAGGKPGASRHAGAAAAKAAAAKPAAKPKPHGFTEGLPGLNVRFAPDDAWDRCIILSPLPAARVKAEVEAKAPAMMKDAIVIPARVKGSGHAITATIDRKALGPPGDVTDWGYQVVIASTDLFPAANSLLVRKVNEIESQHRFGGGTDGDCGPNVLDVLADDGEGDPDEVAAQHEMLQYECNPDGTAKQLATLKMVHVDKDE